MLGGLLLDNEAADKIGDVISRRRISTATRTASSIGTSCSWSPTASRRTSSRCPKSLASAQKLDYVGGLAYLGALVAERADGREHPPLRADRPRSLDPAPARGDGRRDRRLRVQSARPQREGGARRGRGEGPAHRRAGRARRAAVRRRSASCSRASSSGSRRCTTATIPRTSPACPPDSPISTG